MVLIRDVGPFGKAGRKGESVLGNPAGKERVFKDKFLTEKTVVSATCKLFVGAKIGR
jgi:hypothetical protein